MNPSAPLPTVFRVLALAYALFFWMGSWIFTPLRDQHFVSLDLSSLIWKTGCFIALALLVWSLFKPQLTRRILYRNILLGAIGFLPFFMLFGSISTAYLFTVNTLMLAVLLTSIFLITVTWGIYSIKQRRHMLSKTNYMTKYFEVGENEIIYTAPKDRFLLDPPPINDATFLGGLWNKHGYKLAFLAYSGYPLMRVFYDTGGDIAVYLLFFMLCMPLLMYVVVRVVTGAYLFIYKVHQLEKLHGKPVLSNLEEEG